MADMQQLDQTGDPARFMDEPKIPELRPIDEAPKDGTWFFWVCPITYVGVGIEPLITYEVTQVARAHTTGDSPGYWRTFFGSSIADHEMRGGWFFLSGRKQKCR